MTNKNSNAVVPLKGSQFISEYLKSFIEVMPKHIPLQYFGRVILTEFRRTPKLLICSKASLLGAMMSCAETGLLPGPYNYSYIIPYFNKHTGQYEAQFQFGYQGLVQLTRNTGEIKVVFAEVVYKGDEFSYKYGTNKYLDHIPKPGRSSQKNAKMIHVYAIAEDIHGNKHFTVLDFDDVMKIKASAKASTDKYSPWVQWESEMWKKSGLKRLTKFLPLSTEQRIKLDYDESTRLGTGAFDVDITDWDDKAPPVLEGNKSAVSNTKRPPVGNSKEDRSKLKAEMNNFFESEDQLKDFVKGLTVTDKNKEGETDLNKLDQSQLGFVKEAFDNYRTEIPGQE